MATYDSGIGTTLSSNYYLRNFYISNRDARTSSKRSGMDNSSLSSADSKALRRAIRELGDMEYTESKEDSVRNSAKAFIEVYNNALSSTSRSGDSNLERNMKQLKALTKEYASDLDKIGITVNDDGTLKRRDALFSSAGVSKFEKLFSGSSDFMQRVNTCAKRIERRSDDLVSTEQHQKFSKNSKQSESSATEEIDINTLLNTGIGRNINISL